MPAKPVQFGPTLRGFTLIEVLVALAVVVVAFLAMYGSAQQIVRSVTTQQEKTFASWVAFDQLTNLRLADQLPQSDRMSGETEMAGREWHYVIEFNEVDSSNMRQAIVRVGPAEEPELVLASALGVLLIQPGSHADSGSKLQSSASGGNNSGSNAGVTQ